MTNHELNIALKQLEESPLTLPALQGSGKAIPYYGWFWRLIEFDCPFVLGVPHSPALQSKQKPGHKSYPESVLEKFPTWYGFIPNNKWGYAEVTPTPEDRALIRLRCVEAVTAKSVESLQALYDCIQEIGARSEITEEAYVHDEEIE